MNLSKKKRNVFSLYKGFAKSLHLEAEKFTFCAIRLHSSSYSVRIVFE